MTQGSSGFLKLLLQESNLANVGVRLVIFWIVEQH